MAVGRGVLTDSPLEAFNGRVGRGLAWLAGDQVRRLQRAIWHDQKGGFPGWGGGGHLDRPRYYGPVPHP